MRQRLVNEKALAKTLAFLKEVNKISDSPVTKPISLLYSEHGISKATGAACKKLGIFEANQNGTFKWVGDAPSREQALQVLEVLRLRNDKMVAIPLEGFESLVDTLQQLVISLKPKTGGGGRQVGNYKESFEREQQETFVKIVTSIAGGIWNEMIKKPIDDAELNRTNDFIITASKDLLTKIYK